MRSEETIEVVRCDVCKDHLDTFNSTWASWPVYRPTGREQADICNSCFERAARLLGFKPCTCAVVEAKP